MHLNDEHEKTLRSHAIFKSHRHFLFQTTVWNWKELVTKMSLRVSLEVALLIKEPGCANNKLISSNWSFQMRETSHTVIETNFLKASNIASNLYEVIEHGGLVNCVTDMK